MSVGGILVGQNKDTPTILSIKEDTAAAKETAEVLREDVDSILNNTASLYLQNKEIITRLKEDTFSTMKRYGYRIKKNEANPADRIEYIYDAVGMTPVTRDSKTGQLNFNDWANLWFIKYNYPVMLKYDGTEDYQLNPNNYAYKKGTTITAESTPDSDYNNLDYEGNAMSAIPCVWVKRFEDSVYEYTVFCEEQYDKTYHAYAHTDIDGNVNAYAYHALFKGNITDGKLRSIAGLTPTGGTTTSAERAAAQALGSRWDIRHWSLQVLIADLLTLISKSDNSQVVFGEGYTTGGNGTSLGLTGRLYDKGQFYGSSVNNSAADGVKVFHIEDFWGNRWDRLVGLMYIGSKIRAQMTPSYNLTGSGYKNLDITITGTSGGYVRDTSTSEYGRVPVTVTGSDSTYTCDGGWFGTGENVALAGGFCISGSPCGSRFLHLNRSAAHASWHFGASPCYT